MGAQEVVEPSARQSRGGIRKPKAPSAPIKVTATDAKKSAQRTVDFVSRMGGRFAGHPAGEMEPDEKDAIVGPLSGMYQRAPEVSEGVSRWLDPLVLVFSLGMYLLRVTMVQRQVRVAVAAQMAQAQAHAPDIQTVRDIAPEQAATPEPIDFNRNGRSVSDLDSMSRLS